MLCNGRMRREETKIWAASRRCSSVLGGQEPSGCQPLALSCYDRERVTVGEETEMQLKS
jgi:hypothetical protein